MATSKGAKGAATAAPTLDELAARIREESQAGEEADFARALRLGGMLREARIQVPHGKWQAWLKINFHGSITNAKRYVQITDPANGPRVGHCKSVREALAVISKPKTTPKKKPRESGSRLRALHALKRAKDSNLLIARIDIVKMVGILEAVDLPALGFGDADDETVAEIHAELFLLFQWLDLTLTFTTTRLSDQQRFEKIRKLREGTEGRTPEEIATAHRLADKLEAPKQLRAV